MKQVSRPYKPGDPVYWTVYNFDALGRTTSITLPDGSVSSYSYSGNTTTVTDPAGKWKMYTSDAMGNLTQVTEPAPEGGTHLTSYAYNIFNRLTTVTMPRSTGTQTRTFNYDLTTARLMSVTNPETGTTSFEYNDDGTLFRKTDAKGQKVKFTYDSLGRVTVKQTYKSDGTEDLCGKTTNYWDTRPSGVGGTGWENVSGRLMAVRWSASTCPGGQFTEGYQYDTGLPTIKRLYTPTLATNSYIDASFTYNDQGQLQSMAYPVWHGGGYQWPETGKTFTYNLDTLSRPIGLTDESQTALVSGVTYGGPSGQLSALSYSGYNEARLYNVRGQLTRLTATGDGLPSVDLEYRFSATNNDGRITQMEDWVSSEEVNYQYDSLGRLTLAETTGPQWGQSFSYDGFGNLTDETATKGTAPTVHRNYDAATNRLTLDYTYDANGNMTAMPGLGMTYNVENRLIQATSNLNGTESYGYDAAGLRLWKKGPDGVTHVFYNGLNGKPLAEFYPQGGSVRGGDPMVYFAGKRVDNSSVEDRLGTAVVENGQDRMAFFPYGELRSGTSTEVQFATYKRDSVTNLDYAAHRYYSTQIGRFTTPDPKAGSAKAEIPQSWNRYTYALGDPVNGYDPNGAEYLMEDGGAYGMFAAAASPFASVGSGQTGGNDGGGLGQQDLGFIGGTILPTGLSNEGTNVYPGIGPGYVDMAAKGEQWWGGYLMSLQLASGSTDSRISAAVDAAQAALDNPNCASLFNVGKNAAVPDPATLLAIIASGHSGEVYLTFGDLGPPKHGTATNAVTRPTGYAMEPDGTVGFTGVADKSVVVFNSNPGVPFNSGTVTDNATTLLHELGHVYENLFGMGTTLLVDDSSQTQGSDEMVTLASGINTKMVQANCFPTGG